MTTGTTRRKKRKSQTKKKRKRRKMRRSRSAQLVLGACRAQNLGRALIVISVAISCRERDRHVAHLRVRTPQRTDANRESRRLSSLGSRFCADFLRDVWLLRLP